MRMYTLPACNADTTGRWSTLQRPLFFKMYILPFFPSPYMNFAHKYVIFMKGDTLDEMAEEALHFSYMYVMRALQEHRSQGRNGEYEAFAVELLAMLQKYRSLYTTGSASANEYC